MIKVQGVVAVVLLCALGHLVEAESGNVVVWEENSRMYGYWPTRGTTSRGQTAKPAGLTNITAVAAGSFHCLALRETGTVVAWGDNSLGQTNVPPGLTNVWKIAAGGNHSLALLTNGTVVGWGDLSVPTLTNIVALATGTNHALALKADGTVIAWGENGEGQLNVPSELTNAIAIAAGGNASLALRSDSTVVGWGAPHIATVPAGLTNVIAIAASSSHALALRNNQTTLGWGGHTSGLNLFSNHPDNPPATAIAAGVEHSIVLREDTTVRSFSEYAYSGMVLAPLTNVLAIAEGDFHQMAVTKMPVILQHPTNQIGWDWGEVTFSVVAESSAPLSYQWFIGEIFLPGQLHTSEPSPVEGATNSTLTVSLAQATNYFVKVSNEFGTAVSDWARAEAMPPPRLMNSGISTNGIMLFEVTLPPDVSFEIQISTDLQSWDYYGSWYAAVSQSGNGPLTYFFYTHQTTNFPQRYYRLRLSP